MTSKPRIAYLSGSNATISNSPPLVTSNKARAARGLSSKQIQTAASRDTTCCGRNV